ncbi:hypothetical protein C8J56DRAFT_1079114 [Mycena floridula]|nr:hypothetical protein C8J56DRAFT_1079114 [Mycena floridula]
MPPINLTDAQSALQEKARLRRAYEALPALGLSTDAGSAIAEKERVRRKYEMQDRVASNPNPNQSSVLSPPVSPNQGSGIPGNGSPGSNGNGRPGNKRQGSGNERQGSLTGRARPTPPVSAAGQKPMMAAEEKALLGAKFGVTPSANGINGGINGTGTKVPTTPPPLMPCPPVSYIQETWEEDARMTEEVSPRRCQEGFVGITEEGYGVSDLSNDTAYEQSHCFKEIPSPRKCKVQRTKSKTTCGDYESHLWARLLGGSTFQTSAKTALNGVGHPMAFPTGTAAAGMSDIVLSAPIMHFGELLGSDAKSLVDL